jgi:hypothetical protein
MLKLAKFISSDYKFPSCKKISGEYLKLAYDQLYEDNVEKLKKEADIYGITLYADGATIGKTPYINILGCGAHISNACLEIHDCTKRLVDGGKKDSEYNTEIMSNHINRLDPKKKLIDLVIFDGASNMQKAGLALGILFPRITCIHGAEHVVSLFFQTFVKQKLETHMSRYTNSSTNGLVVAIKPYTVYS